MNGSLRQRVADGPESPGDPEQEERSSPRAKPATAAGPSFSRFIMVFLFLLAFWTLVDPQLAELFSAAAGALLMPVIGFGGSLPVTTILLAGMLTTTISSLVRDYFTDWIRMARTQKVMGAWRKAQMDAVRKGNTAEVDKLKEIQKTFQSDIADMTFSPYKSMALTMFLFIVIFSWLRAFVDVTLTNLGNQYIAVPWSSNVYLPSIYVFPSWVLLYSLLALPFGQIVIRVLKFVRFRRRLQELGVPLVAEAEGAA